MKNVVRKVFRVRAGEEVRSVLLFAYLLLIIASYVIGKVARSALFLSRIPADQLPFVILAIAALTLFIIAGYVHIGRRVGVRNLLAGSLVFLALNAVVFWVMFHFHPAPRPLWFSWAFYIWVGIYGVLTPAQVWTLANYVLTTREAKRLFGVVGGGAIAGWIFGGFLSTVITETLAETYGIEILLLLMGVFILACSGLVLWIWKHRSIEADATYSVAPEEAVDTESAWQSLKLVRASPYLNAIAGVICLSSVATTMAGWQMDAIAQQALVTKERLASFFASFYLYCSLIALATQFFLTARVLRRFGIGPALFVVPVALVLGEGGVLVFGTLLAVAVLKGSDQILRYSIDKSTVELLYLPVAPNVKLQVKSFIDTAIWRFGDGLAALAVLVFVTTLKWNPVQVGWVNLIFLAGWMGACLVARRYYVTTLRESIQQHRLDAERAHAPVLDRSTTDILAAKLTDANPEEILYALSVFETGEQQAVHPAVRGLLSHPAWEVRHKALFILAQAGDKSVVSDAERLLSDPSIEVRTEALLFLTERTHVDPLARIQEVGDFPDFSIRSGLVMFLSRPGEAQNLQAAEVVFDGMVSEAGEEGKRTRLEAARLLAALPESFEAFLTRLLADPDTDVVRQAVRSAGKLTRRAHLNLLIEKLGDCELEEDAVEALAAFGDRAVGTLRDHLVDPHVDAGIRRAIPAVLHRVGTPVAARVLTDRLLDADSSVRFRALSALNKLRQQRPEIELDGQMLEMVIAAEIVGHYRSYQILGLLSEDPEGREPVSQALHESMEQEVERIFRLLGLLFPNYDLHSAWYGLQSENAVVHANALEFLDNVLKPQLRTLLVPLLDSEVSVAERIALAEKLLGIKMESREQAVAVLLASDDPWLKSCGAYAVGAYGLRSMAAALDACLNHPDPLLRETARQAKLLLESLPGASPA